MDRQLIEDLLERRGAVIRGHFRLSSGRHSDTYVQCARVLQHPREGEMLAEELAARFRPGTVDVVLSPAMGGVLIGYLVARALDRRFIFAERKGGGLQLRRGQEMAAGERVLMVEDVITTGGSLRELEGLVREAGAAAAGTAAIIVRGDSASRPQGVEALLDLRAASWEEGACPLCRDGRELDSPGSRYL